MITFSHTGDFSKTMDFLKRNKKFNVKDLEKFGKQGVDALAANTPVDSGLTAQSWGYQIVEDKNSVSIQWTNSHIVDGVNIAIIIQYGHATGTGGYVQGRDFINPAIQPIFDQIAENAWKEVTGK